MALGRAGVMAVAKNPEQAVMDGLETVDMDLAEIITLFAGKQVTAQQKQMLVEKLEDSFPDCQVVVHQGDQDVYDYLVGVE